ncbi:MAG: hypothetical protein FI721_00920 [SAR202 cluster bacterium]|nr:hypothetical protein [Dehalococcoidia bacterium]MQG08643.1 hypothetical protein [SAR202 cluster bacterium]CAI8306707.1 MAG: Uncharacterised protein [Chloroflexota bacterium]MQG17248.1 hypothetical protein [SAR202 cluster bacterium]MQG25478.1 hypothetical protein [SAR202 cluster bacterium]
MNFDSKKEGMTRLTLKCAHQHGMVYVIPADRSWVCDSDSRFGHAVAGFMGALTAMEDPRIQTLMQEWGLYYRSLPLESENED